MDARDAELDDLRAEVVEVAGDARFGVDARVELVAALRRGGGGAHAQRVQVVCHGRVVLVLGEVSDREVHRPSHPRSGRWAAPAK